MLRTIKEARLVALEVADGSWRGTPKEIAQMIQDLCVEIERLRALLAAEHDPYAQEQQ